MLGLVFALVCGWVFLPEAAISDRAVRRAACDIRSTSLSLIRRPLSDASRNKTVLDLLSVSFRVGESFEILLVFFYNE